MYLVHHSVYQSLVWQQLRQLSLTRVNKKQYVHCCDITVTRDDVKAFMAQRDEYTKANRFKDITVKVFI